MDHFHRSTSLILYFGPLIWATWQEKMGFILLSLLAIIVLGLLPVPSAVTRSPVHVVSVCLRGAATATYAQGILPICTNIRTGF